MQDLQFDVLIIGAGASGLLAAHEIALTGRSVAVIEAKDRLGGRIFTKAEHGMVVELGAEFVHGDLPLTKGLLEQATAKLRKVEGSIWQHKNGQLSEQEDFINDYKDLEKKFGALQGDKSIARFLAEDLEGEQYNDLRFSVKNYVEGYYAADTAKASTMALCEEWSKEDEDQYRIDDGYRMLVNYLEEQCRKKKVQFFLSHPVLELQWKSEEVRARTATHVFFGRKALITVSIGVLQNKGIDYSPALPHDVTAALQHLGFGHVVKTVLQFEDAFWKDKSLTGRQNLTDLNFLFSDEAIPTWWTHHPKEDAVLIGWLGGPRAEAANKLSYEEEIDKAIFSLSHIFNLDESYVRQKLKTAHIYNWSADPHFCGAYSYEVVGGEAAIKTMQDPVQGTLFFAGEGLHHGPEIGTVEGALASGRDTAHRLIAAFSA